MKGLRRIRAGAATRDDGTGEDRAREHDRDRVAVDIGETVVSQDPLTLSPIPNPPCDLPALCGFPGAQRWTFQAIQGGVGYSKIVFGIHNCFTNGECTTTPYVYKPIAVYTRPQSS